MTTFGADYSSMDDLFPHYDPIEKFIVYVTHEQKAELMLDFIRAGLVCPKNVDDR
jgi:hypothetical protein